MINIEETLQYAIFDKEERKLIIPHMFDNHYTLTAHGQLLYDSIYIGDHMLVVPACEGILHGGIFYSECESQFCIVEIWEQGFWGYRLSQINEDRFESHYFDEHPGQIDFDGTIYENMDLLVCDNIDEDDFEFHCPYCRQMIISKDIGIIKEAARRHCCPELEHLFDYRRC